MKDINLFKQYKKGNKVSTTGTNKLLIPACLFFMLVLFAGVYIYTDNVIKYLKTDIGAMEKILTNPESAAKLKIYNETKNRVEIMKTYVNAVDAIEGAISKTDFITSEFVSQLNSTLPEDMFLQSLRIDENGIQIMGVATSREEIAEYQHNLKGLNLFSEVFVANIAEQVLEDPETGVAQFNNYSFALQCTRKGVNAVEAQ